MNQSLGEPYIDLETLTLTRNGEWLADGEPITHERTIRAFQGHLASLVDGSGWEIRIGRERKKIIVEDTAFFVRAIRGDAQSGFVLELSDGNERPLDPHTLHYSPGRLTCRIEWQHPDGTKGKAEARFLRGPSLEILSLAQPGSSEYLYHLKIQGVTIEIREP
jgi:hypothetical protein